MCMSLATPLLSLSYYVLASQFANLTKGLLYYSPHLTMSWLAYVGSMLAWCKKCCYNIHIYRLGDHGYHGLEFPAWLVWCLIRA